MQQLGHDSSKCLLLVVSWSFAHHRDHLRHGHHEGLETVKSGFPDCDDHDVGSCGCGGGSSRGGVGHRHALAVMTCTFIIFSVLMAS